MMFFASKNESLQVLETDHDYCDVIQTLKQQTFLQDILSGLGCESMQIVDGM